MALMRRKRARAPRHFGREAAFYNSAAYQRLAARYAFQLIDQPGFRADEHGTVMTASSNFLEPFVVEWNLRIAARSILPSCEQASLIGRELIEAR
ncbi:MAG: hypothetical protein ACREDL_25035 [Bradyrhizobium sp.]